MRFAAEHYFRKMRHSGYTFTVLVIDGEVRAAHTIFGRLAFLAAPAESCCTIIHALRRKLTVYNQNII